MLPQRLVGGAFPSRILLGLVFVLGACGRGGRGLESPPLGTLGGDFDPTSGGDSGPTGPTGPNPGDSTPGDSAAPGDNDGHAGPTLPPIEDGALAQVTCDAASLPASGCTSEGSGTALVLVGTVLGSAAGVDTVYEGGAVRVESTGSISCVGCECDTAGARVVRCADAVISPGFINAHDHIGWMGSRPWVPSDEDTRYEHRHDWRKGDPQEDEPKIAPSGGADNNDKAWGELRFVFSGATSINGSGDAPGFLRNLDKSSGLQGLSGGAVLYETFPLGDSGGAQLSANCAYPSIDSPSSAQAARAYTPHVSEGIDAYARNELLCLTSTDRGGKEVLSDNTAIIHGIGLGATDVAVLAGLGTKLIWSPRSNVSLYGETAPVTLYRTLGVPIALGTDWLPSGSMSMGRELRCARELNGLHFGNTFTARELWRMVTVDAAAALGFSAQLGSLVAGRVGDIAVFAAKGRSPYSAAVDAEAVDTLLVLRGGQVLAGESALVDALTTGCDPVLVCGAQKRACVSREIGKSFTQLQTAVGNGVYPLAACGVPPNEPSCAPSRGTGESQGGSTLYTGELTALDADGDGIDDGADSCPSVWNPIRPVDLGEQADFDGDTLGDVCDPCPLTSAETCAGTSANDSDGDGVDNDVDNCPNVPNADQANADGDAWGDACELPEGVVDLSGWSLAQANSAANFQLPSGTMGTPGSTVIVSRQASRSGFETFWGVTLPVEVAFINTGGALPLLNGGETFTLRDANGTTVDGPSFAITEGQCLSRKSPVQPANSAAAWDVASALPASASPGSASATAPGPYVSEVCDPTGSGNYTFEFVEIAIP